jgi:hypothetical protein
MQIEELYKTLNDKPTYIVHFSMLADNGRPIEFPKDLQDCVSNSQDWPLSTHLVWPGHRMIMQGCVGVILRPRSMDSILKAGRGDQGTSEFTDSTAPLGEGLNEDIFNECFDLANDQYNELRVNNSEVIGVYFEPTDIGLRVKKFIEFQDPTSDQMIKTIDHSVISPQEIAAEFGDLPCVTRKDGEFVLTNGLELPSH